MQTIKKWVERNARFLNLGAFIVLIGFIVRIGYFLAVYGDPYPHWDEWRFVPMNKDSIFYYLFQFNNENMQVFTNLIYATLEFLGLPFIVATWCSFIVYLGLCWCLYLVLSSYVSENRRFMLILLFIPFFSDYMLDNLFWAATSSPWFYFMFSFLAVFYGFNKPLTVKNRFLTLLMAILAVGAMNVSLPCLFMVVYVLKNIVVVKSEKELTKEIIWAGILGEILAIVVILFWCSMRKNDVTPINFADLVGLDFYQRLGYSLFNPWFGFIFNSSNKIGLMVLCLGMLLGIGALLVWQYKKKINFGVWAIFMICAGGMVAITLFRGDTVYAITDHACRYLIYPLCCMPALYVLLAGDSNVKVRYVGDVVAILMLVLAVNWFSGRHIETINRINNGKHCAELYYNSENKPKTFICAARFWDNLAPHYDAFEDKYLKRK